MLTACFQAGFPLQVSVLTLIQTNVIFDLCIGQGQSEKYFDIFNSNLGNLWKELLNYTQGRCQSFAINEYIIEKKCKEEIRNLVK